MVAQFDSIVEEIKKAKQVPFRMNEEYTFRTVVGDVKGKSVLDLACGDGYYTRILKQMGATRVIGVDISAGMVEAAQQAEAATPLGIEYMVGDAKTMGKIGEFDLVTAVYLLHFSSTQEELLQMCQTIFANLKPGRRFITFNDNVHQTLEQYSASDKYGLWRRPTQQPRQDGTPMHCILSIGDEQFDINYHFLEWKTYEWALKTAGFTDIKWQGFMLAPLAVETLGIDFWQAFIDYPPLLSIECQ